MLDIRAPRIISRSSKPNILEECSDESWDVPAGATGDEAAIVVDMQCPIWLQDIQVINGVGDHSTKEFTVLGAHDGAGPWEQLFTGELEEGMVEVSLVTYLE